VDLTAIKPGNGLVNMLRETDADFDGPALEIGCGTGLISLGLLKSNAYTTFLFTDPSKEFLNITRNKMQKAMIDLGRARFAVLKAEEIDLLPRDVFSLIALRSTLHHVLDYSKFIEDAAMRLKGGGILTFQEPCLDGYVLMGVIAQFIQLVVNGAGAKLSNSHFKQVQSFVDTMKFYARRDLDKSQAEDKHLFRVDEMMKIGSSSGLSVEFLPNITYDYFDAPADMRSDHVSFYAFFHDYLKYCMSFDQTLMELIEKHFRNYCNYIEEISSSNSPYMHGVFICRKD
jgi:ubiquinone/menaquinone biosynthesis C-methylase UbiE